MSRGCRGRPNQSATTWRRFNRTGRRSFICTGAYSKPVAALLHYGRARGVGWLLPRELWPTSDTLPVTGALSSSTSLMRPSARRSRRVGGSRWPATALVRANHSAESSHPRLDFCSALQVLTSRETLKRAMEIESTTLCLRSTALLQGSQSQFPLFIRPSAFVQRMFYGPRPP